MLKSSLCPAWQWLIERGNRRSGSLRKLPTQCSQNTVPETPGRQSATIFAVSSGAQRKSNWNHVLQW